MNKPIKLKPTATGWAEDGINGYTWISSYNKGRSDMDIYYKHKFSRDVILNILRGFSKKTYAPLPDVITEKQFDEIAETIHKLTEEIK